MGSLFSSPTKTVSDLKKAQLAHHLLNASAYDPTTHAEFTKATAKEITEKIESGEWTASRVLEAYIARASYAHSATNCLTEIMFSRARKQAKELDAEYEATKKLRGPLHGVPVSFKDQFNFAGVETTLGFSQWSGQNATEDADIAAQFIAAGAVPFVKTNIPQTMFAFECNNPVFGRTVNPYGSAYTCGGSTGGEGALLALDGSVIGVGTDIGGSLRIPAHYNGIYSLKPGKGRVSMAGTKSPTPGFEAITTVAGPMARSIADLEVAAKIMFGVVGQDQRVVPIPFRDVTIPSKLRVGYFTSDDFVKASPACKRAVQETVDALRKQGHECVEITLPTDLAVDAFSTFISLSSSDGYKTLTSHLGPDPKDGSLFLVTLAPKIPSFVRSFLGWILETVLGDRLYAKCLCAARAKPMEEYMTYVQRRDQLYQLYKKEVWDQHHLDGLIAPVQALPQLPHGGCKTLSAISGSTILFNVLDVPVGVLPVTHVDSTRDMLTDEWKTGPGLGSKLVERELYHTKHPFYDPKQSEGMPVGVQIVGKKWEEEEVLGMMNVIDRALGQRGFGPGALVSARA